MNIAHQLYHILQLNHGEFVVELYRRLLDREPDEGGAASHLRHLQAGAAKYDVMLTFLLSDEAFALFARTPPYNRDGKAKLCRDLQRLFAKDAESFVRALFRQLFSRVPDADTYARYMDALGRGQPKSFVFAAVVSSAELRHLLGMDKFSFARRTLDQLILSFYK